MRANLDTLERLDGRISDLQSDIRDALNDHAVSAATLFLQAARDDRDRLVAQTARDLRTIEMLFKRAGLEPPVMSRIIAEYNKGAAA